MRIAAVRTARAILVLGVLSALATATTAIVLSTNFRPHRPGGDRAVLPPDLLRSARWTDWHNGAGILLLAFAAMSLCLVFALSQRGELPRRGVGLTACALALVASAMAVLTRALVAWDQLALASVTVNESVSGYWFAAFGDDIVFVLVDGSEVSQAQYAPMLLLHLASPIVAAVALGVVLASLRRSPRQVDGGRDDEASLDRPGGHEALSPA